eukprot:COSAG01_NODE_4090_length_5360_cov_26.230184_6_plen_89_part_00
MICDTPLALLYTLYHRIYAVRLCTLLCTLYGCIRCIQCRAVSDSQHKGGIANHTSASRWLGVTAFSQCSVVCQTLIFILPLVRRWFAT